MDLTGEVDGMGELIIWMVGLFILVGAVLYALWYFNSQVSNQQDEENV
jgi:hypothetical protein